MYKNHLGQELNPGDRVVAIATGYSHAIRIREGVFVGVSPTGNPQVRVKAKRFGYWTADGRNLGYYNRGKEPHVAEHREYERVSTLFSGRVYKLA